ncbi:hypothetical protein Hypma_009854 [Hypsizygus marmoreus]|uniref:Uncharacterized protein n=1 Tax=Hypsizygus marmoreus TaxID=39966 RepID=A0A369JMF8_HYPMA|nr:hypothetical protein Hypma_009854 [Hypsizygus marmoreus]
MTSVTTGSIAYATTQVLFALSSRGAFHKNCKVLDAVTFYNSIIGYLHDPDNKLEVMDLLRWWNHRIFPQHNARLTTGQNSSRAQIKADRMAAAAAAEMEVMG